MNEKIKILFTKNLVVHIAFIALAAFCAAWVYSGLDHKEEEQKVLQAPTAAGQHTILSSATESGGAISSQDEAIEGFLNAAQILAEVYHFTNNGSYAGLCEASQDQYTLEGESGGILKYIKFVGATEVYCSTGNNSYMIEAQMPESKLFYCIDSTGAQGQHAATSEGQQKCVK